MKNQFIKNTHRNKTVNVLSLIAEHLLKSSMSRFCGGIRYAAQLTFTVFLWEDRKYSTHLGFSHFAFFILNPEFLFRFLHSSYFTLVVVTEVPHCTFVNPGLLAYLHIYDFNNIDLGVYFRSWTVLLTAAMQSAWIFYELSIEAVYDWLSVAKLHCFHTVYGWFFI